MEITFEGGKIVTAHTRGHAIRTDQPIDNGGGDNAPSPFDLYLASIGTCTGVYVKSFCDKRQLPTDEIKIIQRTIFNEETGLPVSIILDIRLPRDFPEKYKASLLHVAGLCKVKKSISSPPEFEIRTTANQ